MRVPETELSLVIFIVGAIALPTFWNTLWAVLQLRVSKLNSSLKNPNCFAVEFFLFNLIIVVVFLSSLKPFYSEGKAEEEINRPCYGAEFEEVEDEINMLCQVAEIEERMNDDDGHDHDDGSSDYDECEGGSECSEDGEDYVHDDDIDPADLEKRANELIARMRQGWMEEKLSYELSMIPN